MKFHRALLRHAALLAVGLLGSGAAQGDVPVTAVPPGVSRAPVAGKLSAPRFVLPSGAPALTIALPAPAAAERGRVKAQNLRTPSGTARELAAGGKLRPLAIGFGRAVPAE